jgi:hypothetical protein
MTTNPLAVNAMKTGVGAVIGFADPPDTAAVYSSIAASPVQSRSNNWSCST